MYQTALSTTPQTSVLCMNKGLVAVGYVPWAYVPYVTDGPVTIGLCHRYMFYVCMMALLL